MNSNQIIALISKIRRNSSAFLENELNKAGLEGIISSHGAILGALYRGQGKLKMKEIADIINKDKSTVTYLVKSLCNSGLITRQKGVNDSRETYILLTEKGWEMEGKFNCISEKLITTAFVGFTEPEKQTLLDLLKKMNSNFIE
ncbi:MAG: MarR family winged helix-turn-helix transcriptional regulator [Bacillota bacterium]|nr:MarR family winged helix-turn-helix transcriptional regulator [Bacillota bacterium]